MPRGAALLLALTACTGSPRAVDDDTWVALRAAVVLDARPEAWIVRGDYRDGAGEGRFEDRFARDGRYARRHLSALPGGAGDDGELPWALPIDGLPRPAGGRPFEEARVTAWVLSGAWLDPALPLEVTRAGRSTFALGLGGAAIAELAVDPDTALPRSLEFPRADGHRTLAFEDWRTPLGFPIAHTLELSNARGTIARWRVREALLVEQPLASAFSPPAAPTDARFADAPDEVAAMRAGARMLVRVVCGGTDGGWWLVDTGAGASAIDPALADLLGWERLGVATLVGAGGGATRGLRRAGELSVGPLVAEGLPLVEADAEALSATLGVTIDGVLGADLLARCVLELDFASERAWVRDPRRWAPPPSATPVSLDGVVPLVACTFAPGHHGQVRLDTGSDDTLTLHGPTVRRLGLVHGREDLVTVRIRGVGGEVLGDRGPLAWLELGGQRYEALPVTYLRHSTGGLARADLAGNAGAALFAGKRLVIALPLGCIVVE